MPPPQSYYVNSPKPKAASKPVPKPTPAPEPILPGMSIEDASKLTTDNDGWDEPVPAAKPAPTKISREASPAPRLSTENSSSTVNLASLSKEEKDKEMARRREERKAVSLRSVHPH